MVRSSRRHSIHLSSRRLLFAALVCIASLSATEAVAEEHFKIDPAHSFVTFRIRHLVSYAKGRFKKMSGDIEFHADKIARSSVRFALDAASISTDNPKRDAHLRSPDFFDVKRFPSITFQSTSVRRDGKVITIAGVLSMHGVKKIITIPARIVGKTGDRIGFEGKLTLDRKEFGITWNKILDRGGAMLGDQVFIDLLLEAKGANAANLQMPPD